MARGYGPAHQASRRPPPRPVPNRVRFQKQLRLHEAQVSFGHPPCLLNCLLLRLGWIESDIRRSVISIEVTDMDSKDGNAVSWRCVAYGDIYDLVPDTTPGELEPPLIRVQGRGVEQPIVQVHQAPKGYHYRKLNDADTEVTSDVVGECTQRPSVTCGTWYELTLQILLVEFTRTWPIHPPKISTTT